MIPILYDKTETLFSSNGLGRLRDCISCKVTEERNGVYECDFEYPINGAHYSDIICGRIIAVTHDNTGDVQPFDIISRENPINGVVTFHAVHISYRQNKITVSGSNVNSLSDAFAMLSDTTPANPFTYFSDFSATGFLALADKIPHTVREVLGGTEGSILDVFGGEYKWDKWSVNLLANRGKQREYTIRYGVNLTDYNEEIDYSGTYSQVIPYWTDGTKIVKGDPVTYPVASYTGRDECVPLDLSDKFDSKPTKAQVEALAESRINASTPILPNQSIEIQFVRLADSPEYAYLSNLQHFELCDTIKVEFPAYGMNGRFKIVKTVYDALLERFEEMELGTVSTSLAEALGVDSSGSSVATIKSDHGATSSYTSVAGPGNEDVAITFNASFATAPNVVGVLYDVRTDANATTNAHQLVVQVKSVTTSGATFNIRNNGSATRKTLLSWVAIGN